MATANKRPIIVIKKKGGHGGHHGGAWKVAYADFVTAMMSLFIVLWLMNSTPQIKKAVAGYFKDPLGKAELTGTAVAGNGPIVSIDKTQVEKLKEQIQKAILKQDNLSKLSKQIEITITAEGLRIELLEEKGGTFFELGSAKLSPSGVALLNLLASQLKDLPNKLFIEGHTDAVPYPSDTYTNWELSTDRANAARKLLQVDGLRKDQISQVRGYADQFLKYPDDPLASSNRRITMIVQWIEGPDSPETQEPGKEGAAKDGKFEKGGKEGKEAPGKKDEKKDAGKDAKKDTKEGKEDATRKQPEPSKPTDAAKPGEPAKGATPAAKPPAKPSLMDRLKSFLPGKKSSSTTPKEPTKEPVKEPSKEASPEPGKDASPESKQAPSKPSAAKPTLMERLKNMLPGKKSTPPAPPAPAKPE